MFDEQGNLKNPPQPKKLEDDFSDDEGYELIE
jgi:hypothetical protein